MKSERFLCLVAWIPLACGADSASPAFFAEESGGSATILASGGAAGEGGAPASGGLEVAPGGAPSSAGGSGGVDSAGGTPSTGGAAPVSPPIMTGEPEGYPYDTTVEFDWPATLPMDGKCRPGTYSGEFECDMSGGLGWFIISGPVVFTLAPSASGEFLEITGGKLQFDVENLGGSFPAEAGISGELDCATNALTASVENGVGVSIVPFFGTMEGDLDRLTETLTGTWSLRDGTDPNVPPFYSCTGTWSTAREESP